MISERLEEKFSYHKTDKRNDMWFHYDLLNGIGQDSNVIMELGTRGIVSTWAFLHGLAGTKERLVEVSEDRKKLITQCAKCMWSFDINHPSDYGADIEEVTEIASENLIDWKFVQEDTLKTELPLCDSIFFDTDHTYDQLSQELKLHGNKARKYLVFHDTMKYGAELVPAINEFLEENEEWVILHCVNECHGLTVLVKDTAEHILELIEKLSK
jgi:hypothetical protein|tara:strand:- start:124 stop:762 length:639 start_codon:yes stop_codon:yes gene_type:complete